MKPMTLESYGSSLLQTATQTLLAIFLAAYAFWKWKFLYWEKLGIPSPAPSFPFGAMPPFSKKFVGLHLKDIYNQLKSAGRRHGGIYQFFMPVYLVLDPKLIRHILQHDFEKFTERGFYYNEKDDPLTANLVTLGGKRWRNLRTKLSPVFTSAKVKYAFHHLIQCADQMKSAVEACCLHKQPLDTKQAMACYTTDVIGSCAFGLDCNSFVNTHSPFRQHGDRAFSFTSKLRAFKGAIGVCWPNFARALGITVIDKEASNFFINVVNDTVKYRKSNNIIRKDMLQTLMELYSDCGSKNAEKKKADIELAANVVFFFLAGFETSSTTLTYCLYELACNSHVQDKLRNEITTVLSEHGEEITFESVKAMTYLSQVLDESLRKHPPFTFISRVCEQEYHVPDTDLTLEKGIRICVPIIGLHHDPEYYPNPEVFDPERFSEENKKNRVPFTYVPFGEGPRLCIGYRFAMTQIKVALVTLVKNYRFSLNEKTDVPLQYEEFCLVLSPNSQVLLNVEKLYDEQ